MENIILQYVHELVYNKMAQCLELITNSFYLLIFFIFWLTSNGYFRWQHDLRVGAVNLNQRTCLTLLIL